MKNESLNESKEFIILYNALSVGWHLRRIIEAEPGIVSDPRHYQRFIAWLERHNIKPNGRSNTSYQGRNRKK